MAIASWFDHLPGDFELLRVEAARAVRAQGQRPDHPALEGHRSRAYDRSPAGRRIRTTSDGSARLARRPRRHSLAARIASTSSAPMPRGAISSTGAGAARRPRPRPASRRSVPPSRSPRPRSTSSRSVVEGGARRPKPPPGADGLTGSPGRSAAGSPAAPRIALSLAADT